MTNKRTTKQLEKFLSAPECAELAGIAPDTFTSYVNRGYAPEPVGRVGNRRIWDRATVEAWVSQRAKSE